MPRISRKCYSTSFFHVIVQGLNREYIFKNDRYIKMYLKLLNKYKKDVEIEIIAYCVMSNHAHMILYTEKIDEMSKFMKKLNTRYAKYYNYMEGRVGYVFRDRYLSEEIKDEKYLINCINYVHRNPVKAKIVENCEDYKFSSYKSYLNGISLKQLEKILNVKLERELFINIDSNYVFKDVENSVKENMNLYIEDFLKVSDLQKEELTKDRIILKLLIRYLKISCNVKYTEMMEFFNITKGQMENLKR